MKYHLLALLLGVLTSPMFAQLEYDFKLDDNGRVYFDEVIEVEGETKEELFFKGKDWIFDTFDSGEAVIDYLHPDEGKIRGEARTQNLIYKNTGVKKNGGHIEYKISLLFKEGRSKILIDNLKFEKGDMMGVNSGAYLNEDYPEVFGKFGKKQIQKQWVLMRQQAIAEIELIISDYRSAIKKSSDDW